MSFGVPLGPVPAEMDTGSGTDVVSCIQIVSCFFSTFSIGGCHRFVLVQYLGVVGGGVSPRKESPRFKYLRKFSQLEMKTQLLYDLDQSRTIELPLFLFS